MVAVALVSFLFGAQDGAGSQGTAVEESRNVPWKDHVRLGLMRGVPEKWDLERNFDVFVAMLDKAVAQKVEFFVTPECWLDGYAAADKTPPAADKTPPAAGKASTPEKLEGVAQDLEGSPYLRRVADEARNRRLFICFGFTSLENGRLYNAIGLWNEEGERVGVYHKTHLQTHDLQFASGEQLPVWSTPWGPVGIVICADRRWPETMRVLRLEGARLILAPSYGFTGDLNEAMMRTRSYENQCFVAFTHPTLGLVTDPKGAVVGKKKSESPGLLVCEVDLSRARDDNHLRDRRPELYGPLTEPK